MYTRPVAPLSIGGVVDDAIKLFTASFRRCFVLSLIGALLLGLSGLYVAVKMASLGLGVAAGRAQDPASAMRNLSLLFSSLFGSYLVITLVSLVVYLGLFAHINDVATAAPARGQLAVLGAALRKLPLSIVAAIVFGIAVFVGSCLLVIPGIYLYGKLELWMASMFADDIGGIEALGRSWSATSGNWWRSVVAISVALIIIFVLELLVGGISGLVAGIMGLTHAVDLVGVTIVSTIIRSVIYIAILPMLPAAMLAIYNDLKLRHEGADLAARAKSIQQPA
jgi:hypothetical protein